MKIGRNVRSQVRTRCYLIQRKAMQSVKYHDILSKKSYILNIQICPRTDQGFHTILIAIIRSHMHGRLRERENYHIFISTKRKIEEYSNWSQKNTHPLNEKQREVMEEKRVRVRKAYPFLLFPPILLSSIHGRPYPLKKWSLDWKVFVWKFDWKEQAMAMEG